MEMKHSVVFKQEGTYTGGFLEVLPDGRLTVAMHVRKEHSHMPVGAYVVLVSTDDGESWAETDDPTIPANWTPTGPYDRRDHFALVKPDGSYLAASSGTWEVWPVERRQEAEEQGLRVATHPSDNGSIMVHSHRLFVQRSIDSGLTWMRREWDIPGFKLLTAFPRYAHLSDGTVLVPLYGDNGTGDTRPYVWRSTDAFDSWGIHSMGVLADGLHAGETALLEVSPGRVLAMHRAQTPEIPDRYLLQNWSDDGGLTWSHPMRTDIWGYPPHLLKLSDGRVLCSVGYRREPMGIRAVLSNDGGKTWDMDNLVVLRDDGGYPSSLSNNPGKPGDDLGYPISTQLSDGSILTVYYITGSDGVTHVAATRWRA
jgi:hypothetical protein